jgi:hypothetical protein
MKNQKLVSLSDFASINEEKLSYSTFGGYVASTSYDESQSYDSSQHHDSSESHDSSTSHD